VCTGFPPRKYYDKYFQTSDFTSFHRLSTDAWLVSDPLNKTYNPARAIKDEMKSITHGKINEH
jgi:hypothetical protein